MHRRVDALRFARAHAAPAPVSARGPPPSSARVPHAAARDGQVLIISDTFGFSEPLVQELGGHSLFANHFELDGDGTISGFKLRIRGQKERIVSGLKSAGFMVAAMGDSLNDLSLLRSSDHRVLYRPVEALRAAFPDAPLATNLDQALVHMEWAARAEAARAGQ